MFQVSTIANFETEVYELLKLFIIIIIIIIIIITRIFIHDNLSVLIKRTVIKRVL